MNSPLSLYVHLPWCIKKCPYCDFNSHAIKGNSLPEIEYLNALKHDLKQDVLEFSLRHRPIQSLFIGGGTPSLFSPNTIGEILSMIQTELTLTSDVEITMEANPGTFEQDRFTDFRKAGINRLSIGIQSFNSEKLQSLGRIHDDKQAIKAIDTAYRAGFNNINLDLMYGLPNQTLEEALSDLSIAFSFAPQHLSWYQLTLEPNTEFYVKPPKLPEDDSLWEMQMEGQSHMAERGFLPYEISAYTHDKKCKHNLNYWLFGDYLGIGAGAHGKISDPNTHTITRTWKTKHPKDYLNTDTPFIAGRKILSSKDIALEFMLNALRLYQPISVSLFESRTGLSIQTLAPQLNQVQKQGLLMWDETQIETTSKGKQYLNELLEVFL